jgi:hypothetical protein
MHVLADKRRPVEEPTMREWFTIACTIVALLMAGGAAAQETRGTISGTVRDKDGVLPGANVTITNTGTNVSQRLVTNAGGYFEAPLLIAGAYDVSVEVPNFKSFRQTGIQLAVGQSVPLTITLDVGDVRERVDVVAAAVLLDTNAVSSGLTFENRLITELPTFSSMPLLLIRNVSGVAASAPPSTRSMAPPMPATPATWPRRPIPTCCRRCESKRRTSMRRWDTARGSASR